MLVPMSRPERKYILSAATGYNFDSSTGSIALVNGVALTTIATAADSRVGREIRLQLVRIRGTVAYQDTTVSPSACRLALVRQKQPTGSTPALTDIWASLSSLAFRNYSLLNQFEIVWEWFQSMGHVNDTATQATAGSPTVATIDVAIPMNNIVVRYSGTGATISSLATNALFLCSLGNRAAADGYIFLGSVEVTYVDN